MKAASKFCMALPSWACLLLCVAAVAPFGAALGLAEGTLGGGKDVTPFPCM